MAALAGQAVGVIGLGVVGGSLAKALARAGADVRAYAASAGDRDGARRDGIRVCEDIASCVAATPVVFIAVPMQAHAAVAAAVVDAARGEAALMHTASLQSAVALAAAGGGPTSYRADVARRVLGTHPIAGSHRSGFDAADVDMFAGSVVSIETRADAGTRAIAESTWRAAGAGRLEYRTADQHDELMTWVSHLPQLASTALAHAIAAADVQASALGPGARDATRLAASPFELWAGILAGAGPGAARAAAALEQTVGALRVALERGDVEAVARLWRTARAWRSAPERDNDAAVGTATR